MSPNSLALLLLAVASFLLRGPVALGGAIFALFLLSLVGRRSRKRARGRAPAAEAKRRPLKVIGQAKRGQPAGGWKPESAASLQQHAQRALGTLDPIVREPLLPGMLVVICLGEGGLCGTVLLADVFAELQREGRAECPSCRACGQFVHTRLSEESTEPATLWPREEPLPPPITWRTWPKEDEDLLGEDEEDLDQRGPPSREEGLR